MTGDCLQDLYAFVFSTGILEDRFNLRVLKDLLPNDTIAEKVGVVTVETRDDSLNVFEMLEVSMTRNNTLNVDFYLHLKI